ncbi:MAG: hypothetical protein ABI791_03260 [Acidobacteriota bacterium]
MTFAETLIIYLSLGAPVGVYYLQREVHIRNASDAARFLLAFLLWPATLLRIISTGDVDRSKIIFAENSASDAENERLVQTIFELAKRDLDQSGRRQETAQFREMLERYAGLLGALGNSGTGSEHLAEFYIAAGNPNPKLAAVCQSRRAGAKLELHARAVSAEVRHFFGKQQISDELRAAVALLADNLEDEATVLLLGGDARFATGLSSSAAHIELGQEPSESARAA